MCGHCCLGEGGIVMSPLDRARLAAHLGLAPEDFLARYARRSDGKTYLRTGEDGYCVFFREGCSVHRAKPDICRAWPFFRGNLVDEASWEMAQDFCPGINPAAGHAEFVRQGLACLRAEGVLERAAGGGDECAAALRIPPGLGEDL
ncbi:MAG: YkgJ family cysteine cluster protein [Desulfovibrionaceae bacterium]|jgi:Fe-S-cluster containining protein|nr:YkgJ family cysteine cluster protein [Desulfovibrionaceae bacterium]